MKIERTVHLTITPTSKHTNPTEGIRKDYSMSSQHSRIPSSLPRSQELLSMEAELLELLQNSHLTEHKKEQFESLLISTFDLFQVRYNRGSLIDGSDLVLYSKMQSLVGSLASLLISDDESISVKQEIKRDYSDVLRNSVTQGKKHSPSFRSRNLPTFEEYSRPSSTQSSQSPVQRHRQYQSYEREYQTHHRSQSAQSPSHSTHQYQRQSLIAQKHSPYGRPKTVYLAQTHDDEFDETVDHLYPAHDNQSHESIGPKKRYSMRF